MSTNDEMLYCAVPEPPQSANERNDRILNITGVLGYIIYAPNKWVNHSVLTYYFYLAEDEPHESGDWPNDWSELIGSEEKKELVRLGFKTWKDIGINLTFREINDPNQALVRIAFKKDNKSWSYVGKEIASITDYKPTMNLGFDLDSDPEGFFQTILHEIGHTLGLNHEHQNPEAGIEWDEEKVYEYLSGPPNNWSNSIIQRNVLEKISLDDKVQNSSWDVNSIMHYPFPAGLILSPELYKNNSLDPEYGLSPRDKEWAQSFYPESEEDETRELNVLHPQIIDIHNGEQINYTLDITQTREYDMQLSGESDAVIVLFEEKERGWTQIDASDDTGRGRNAHIRANLEQDKNYILRIRMYWSGREGRTIVTLW